MKLAKRNDSFSNAGFTVVEALISAALLSGLSVAVLSLTGNLSKVGRKTNQDMKVNSLRMELVSVFKNVRSCEATLGGLSSSGDSVPAVIDSSGDVVLTNGGVYGEASGNAQGRLTVNNVDITNYNILGSPYSSDASAPAGTNDRTDGTIDVVVGYSRGDRSRGRSDESELQAGGGNTTGSITVPVQVTIDNSGNIITCRSTESSFVDLFCYSFDGDSTYDRRCRHLTIQDGVGNTDYAATFKGNVNIQSSDITANSSNNHLYIFGSAGAGRPAESGALDADDGRLSLTGSLLAGQGLVSTTHIPGSGQSLASVGVGIDPEPSADGTLKVRGSMAVGSGSNIPGMNGSLTIKHSLGVGAVAPPLAGTVQVSGSIGVGMAPPSASPAELGSLSISVGSGVNDPGPGNVVVQGFIHLPNAPNNDDNPTHAATQEWVSRKVAHTLNPDVINDITQILNDILSTSPAEAGAIAICKGFRVRNAKTPGTSYSAQGVYSSTNGCRLAPFYCNVSGQCESVFAESGGVRSRGDIEASPGNITSNSGDIMTRTGRAEGSTVRGNKICLPDPTYSSNSPLICKTSWNTINITHSACYARASGTSCNNGDFLTKINITQMTGSFVTGITGTPNYYQGRVTSVTVNNSNTNVEMVDNLSYICCKPKSQ